MKSRTQRPRKFARIPQSKPAFKLADQDEALLAMWLCQDEDAQEDEIQRMKMLVDTRKEN